MGWRAGWVFLRNRVPVIVLFDFSKPRNPHGRLRSTKSRLRPVGGGRKSEGANFAPCKPLKNHETGLEPRALVQRRGALSYISVRTFHNSGNSTTSSIRLKYDTPDVPPVPLFSPITRSTVVTWLKRQRRK
jgi:hypothetical protein